MPFLAIEVAPRLLLEHPDDIDELLRRHQVLLRAAGLRIGDVAEMHQGLRREAHKEVTEGYLGRVTVRVPVMVVRFITVMVEMIVRMFVLTSVMVVMFAVIMIMVAVRARVASVIGRGRRVLGGRRWRL